MGDISEPVKVVLSELSFLVAFGATSVYLDYSMRNYLKELQKEYFQIREELSPVNIITPYKKIYNLRRFYFAISPLLTLDVPVLLLFNNLLTDIYHRMYHMIEEGSLPVDSLVERARNEQDLIEWYNSVRSQSGVTAPDQLRDLLD